MAKQPQIQHRNTRRLQLHTAKSERKPRPPRNGECYTRCHNCCVRIRFTDFDDPDHMIFRHLAKHACLEFDYKASEPRKFRLVPAKVGSQ